jgi:hypothetical protein
VRIFGEQQRVPMIRINPDDAEERTEKRVVIKKGALAALRELEKEWKGATGG